MSDVFLSYVSEDSRAALQIAEGLESAGYDTWYYERDSVPGRSYLLQTGRAIDESHAMILLISPSSLQSFQVDREVDHAHERGMPIVPVLLDVGHAQFRTEQPKWRMVLGTVVMIQTTSDDVATAIPRIVRGLREGAGVIPSRPDGDVQPHPAPPQVTIMAPAAGEAWEMGKTARVAWSVAPEGATVALDVALCRGTERVLDIAGRDLDRAATSVDWTAPAWLPAAGDYYVQIQARDREGRVATTFAPVRFVQATELQPVPEPPPGPESDAGPEPPLVRKEVKERQEPAPSLRSLPRPFLWLAGVAALLIGALLVWQLRPEPEPSRPTPTRPAAQATSPVVSSGDVVFSGRLVDGDTNRGIANMRIILLRPEYTYQQWLGIPDVINQAVAASGTTDQDGVFRTDPGLERGKTYGWFTWSSSLFSPYAQRRETLTVAGDGPGVIQAGDIALRVSAAAMATPGLLPLIVPSPTRSFSDFLDDFFRSLGTPIPQPLGSGVVVSGRLIAADTSEPVGGAEYIILRPGATYQQWLDAPGIINDTVAAHGQTDSTGVFRTAPEVTRGQSYVVVGFGGFGYSTQMSQLNLATDAPALLELADFALPRSF